MFIHENLPILFNLHIFYSLYLALHVTVYDAGYFYCSCLCFFPIDLSILLMNHIMLYIHRLPKRNLTKDLNDGIFQLIKINLR